MWRLVFIVFVIWGGLSCESEVKSLIDDEQIVNILVDVHLAEAAVQHLTGIRKDTTLRKYYKQIYEIHEVNKVDFDSTLSQLSKNPEKLRDIYTMVQDTIQVRSLLVKKEQ